MHTESVRVGRIEIAVICEGWAPLALENELPGTPVDWDIERRRFPWAFTPADAWPWHVHAFVVRTPHDLVVVDVGLGAFPPFVPWAEPPPSSPWASIDASQVSHVALTHLHADHSGGAVATDGSPRFPNATYHLHPADWAHFAGAVDREDYVARKALMAVDAVGALQMDQADAEIAPGITTVHSPGHTPGHRSVLVRDRDDAMLLTGDLLHQPTQCSFPDRPSDHDEDAELGARSRVALMDRAREEGLMVGVPHFARPFGSVGPDGWQTR